MLHSTQVPKPIKLQAFKEITVSGFDSIKEPLLFQLQHITGRTKSSVSEPNMFWETHTFVDKTKGEFILSLMNANACNENRTR